MELNCVETFANLDLFRDDSLIFINRKEILYDFSIPEEFSVAGSEESTRSALSAGVEEAYFEFSGEIGRIRRRRRERGRIEGATTR